MKQVIKSIFIILNRKEKQQVWQIAVLDVCISLLDIIFLIALLYLVGFYTHSVAPRFPVFNQHPLLLIACFFLLFAAKNGFGFLVSKMEFRFVYNVASRISRDKLLEYLNGSYHNYVHVDSSVVSRKINQQPIEFCHYVLNGMQQVFSQVVLIIITVVAIVTFNPLLFPLLLLFLAPPVFLTGLLMKRKLHATRVHGKRTSEKAMQHLQEALTGFVESNIYNKNDFFTNRYYRYQSQLNHYLSERLIIQNVPARLIEAFAVFGLFLLLVLNSFATHNSSIPLVTIGAFMVAAYKIIPGIVKIANTMSQVKTYAYSAAGLAGNDYTMRKNDYKIEPVSSLAFENVSFSYTHKTILDNFSFCAGRGEMVGIAGLSGRGKTTFVNLLLGFLNEDSGNICINESVAVSEDRQKYRNRIAYIKQQSFFIHASVIENIILEEGKYDRSKLACVSRVAGVDKFIRLFPDGLETIVTENGKNFSGGQRQRIVFARALYKDFDVMILDEPFNELDEASETEMLEQLQKISSEGKIILLITHNKAALSFCNKKILMDE